MPELPEVETILRGIQPSIEDQVITHVVVRQHQLRWRIPTNLAQQLQGKRVIEVTRRGKYLLFNLDNQGWLIVHLGMSGSLRLLSLAQPLKKHDHVDIELGNKIILRYNDPRRFGAILWTRHPPDQHRLLAKLGPEPLTPSFSGKYLWNKAQGRVKAIKPFIMDHHIVVGVGNIYAAEALFLAGIHPTQAAGSISQEKLTALVKAIKQVLREAIRRGGTTLRDYVNSEGKPGYFTARLKVYGRAGLPCVKCHTPLLALRIGQRIAVYCEYCQR